VQLSRREAVLSAALVGLVALAVRVWAAGLITFPRPEDTAYYVDVARNLVSGRGLTSDAIWSYGTPPLEFPRPAFEVWLPLPTLLVAGSMLVLGQGFAAAQVVPVALGVIVAILAWRLGADVAVERAMPPGRSRTLALGTGFTAAVYLPLVLHSTLPDSTMLFAALTLAATLLMARILRRPAPRGRLATDPRVLALGAVLGLAALTRNEAAWLALAWAILALRAAIPRWDRVRLIWGAAVVALLVFLPWAIRDWLVFGSPLPGQALANALSLDGRDIFAWQEQPTLERYLAAGWPTLLELRWTGLVHNVLNVLVVPGVPVGVIGLVALPWTVRGPTLRPLVLAGGITFLVTTLAFPVATTWGTFLHAAGAIQVLLAVSALLALDRLIVAVGRRRGWTRPVAWLAPTLTVAGGLLLTIALLPGFGDGATDTALRYRALSAALAGAGEPLGPGRGPVITDNPIWLAEATGTPSLALPDEPAAWVLDLARHFPGTDLLVTAADNGGIWPEVLDQGGPAAACFRPVSLSIPATDPLAIDPAAARALDGLRAWRIDCG
jgi:hypothetical protein